MKIIKTLCAAALVTGLVAGCASQKHENQAALSAQAKVSKADAERIALAQVHNGTVKESELEKEKGRLIWSLDISTPDSKDITEVNVDAITGQIVNVEKETAKQEGAEKD
jgi:uncharacterized membrane protein YkoI